MQAGVAYELRMDIFNACCDNPEIVASIPITQNADCVDTFCCDTAFGQPYFADANGVNIPNSDVCGGSTVQMCMTVSGSALDPASNCAECINISATARDFCNPNAPTETVVLDLINIGNASNLYCATINLPEYTSPNACPDIRVIGSNVCCPLLDEFVTEIPFTGSCNTNTCCDGDVLIDNLTVYQFYVVDLFALFPLCILLAICLASLSASAVFFS